MQENIPRTTQEFESLIVFKKFFIETIIPMLKDKIGTRLYNKFIAMYLDDFLENLEMHIEELGEQSILDEEELEEEILNND